MATFFSRNYLLIALGAAILIALPASIKSSQARETYLESDLAKKTDAVDSAETAVAKAESDTTYQQGKVDGAAGDWKPLAESIKNDNSGFWDKLGKLSEEQGKLIDAQGKQITKRKALSDAQKDQRKAEDKLQSNHSGDSTTYFFAAYAVFGFSLFIAASMFYHQRLYSNPETEKSIADHARKVYAKGWTILEATYYSALLYFGFPILDILKELTHK